MPNRRGRPQKTTLRPEHAEILRKAVKACCDYYGMRLRDLARDHKPSWIAAAMKSGPMTVETARELFTFLWSRDPRVIARKKPKGRPVNDLFRDFMKKRGETNSEPIEEPGAKYLGYAFLALLVVRHYFAPCPGSSIFVMPGAAQANADLIIQLCEDLRFGKRKTDALRSILTRFFEICERPFARGKELIPRLAYLGLSTQLEMLNEALDVSPMSDEEADKLVKGLKASRQSEDRRSRELRKRR